MKLALCVGFLSCVLILSGCSTKRYDVSEAYLGKGVDKGDATYIDSKLEVIDQSPNNLKVKLSNNVTDAVAFDKYRLSYKELTTYYILPGHSYAFFCNHSTIPFLLTFDALMGVGLIADVLVLTPGQIIGDPWPGFTCNPANHINETIKKNPTPDLNSAHSVPVENKIVKVESPEMNGWSESLKTNEDGVLALNIMNHLPEEAVDANVSLTFSDNYGNHSTPLNLPRSYVAKAIEGSAKRRYLAGPPRLITKIAFSEPSGNKVLDAGETGKLLLTVTNNGKGDAFNVVAEIEGDKKVKGLEYAHSYTFGTIPSGKTVRAEIALAAGENIASANLNFTINLREAGGFDSEPVQISFKSKAFDPPQLILADRGINDPDGNDRVEPGKNVTLTARIQNIGHGIARNVVAVVEKGPNVFFTAESQSRFELGDIPSGQYQDITLTFYTNRKIANNQIIPLTITVSEAHPQYGMKKSLDLAMNAPPKPIDKIIVAGDAPLQKEITVAEGLSVDVDLNIPKGTKAGQYDVAVIIGNKNYSEAGIANVEYAEHDARVMRKYLEKTFGFDPKNIIYAENATVGKFNEIFGTESSYKGKLYQFIKPNVSNIFVYYVGHGAPGITSHKAYFIPVDANPQYLETNGYKLQTFYANLKQLPAKKITVVLDACFSGNSDSGPLNKGMSPAALIPADDVQMPMSGVLITSSANDQVSTWYPEKQHSLFTYYFLKGIKGEADANDDGKITVSELKKYLHDKVPYMALRLKSVEQEPTVLGNSNDVLVTLK